MILTLSDLSLAFHVLGATCVYQAFLLLVLTYNFCLRQLVVLLQAFLTRRSVKATVAETPYRIQASNSSPEEENEDVDHDGGGDDLDDDGVDDDANYDAHQHWGSAHSGRQTATGAGAMAGREPRLEIGWMAVLVLQLRQKIKTNFIRWRFMLGIGIVPKLTPGLE